MSKDIKKIVLSCLVIMGGFIISDIVVGKIGHVLYDRLPDFGGQIVKNNYITNRLKDVDVVVVGSSRAEHHYVPSIIKGKIDSVSQSSCSVYNAGIDGCFLNYHCCWIENIINRYNPKLLILDIQDSFIYSKSGSLNFLYPFYENNEVVGKYLEKNLDKKDLMKLNFNSYCFNGMFFRLLSGVLEDNIPDDGYAPLTGVMKPELISNEVNDDDKDYNMQLLSNLDDIINLCRDKEVQLVFVSSPAYKSGYNMVVDSLAKRYDVPYLDMMNSEYFNEHPELFQDRTHLNDNGARSFSQILCEWLIRHYNEPVFD